MADGSAAPAAARDSKLDDGLANGQSAAASTGRRKKYMAPVVGSKSRRHRCPPDGSSAVSAPDAASLWRAYLHRGCRFPLSKNRASLP